MPIISGGSSSGGGAVTSLYDSGALGAPAATIDTGANGIAQTAKHLRVYIRAGSSRASQSDNLVVKINNDGGTNYDYNNANNHAGTFSGVEGVGSATPQPFTVPASTALRTLGIVVFDIVDYTANGIVQAGVGAYGYTFANTPNDQNGIGSVLWIGNAPITRLAISLSTGPNLIAGSRMTIYGFN